MKNEDYMILRVSRRDVLEYEIAIMRMIWEFEDEIRDPETTYTRREIAQSSIDHRWQPVYDRLHKIFQQQDELDESL